MAAEQGVSEQTGLRAEGRFLCSHGCDRSFSSFTGMRLHTRRAHLEAYSLATLAEVRAGPHVRWSDAERELLAIYEAALSVDTEGMADKLLGYFPKRSLDAIKGARKRIEHKERVRDLRSREAEVEVEVVEIPRIPVVGDRPPCERWVDMEELLSPSGVGTHRRGRHWRGCTPPSPDPSSDPESGSMSGDDEERNDWLDQRLLQLKEVFGPALEEEFPELFGALQDRDIAELGRLNDEWLDRLIPPCTRAAGQPRRPERPDPTESKRMKARRQYRLVQMQYKQDRTKCAANVLSATLEYEDTVGDAEKVTFWRNLMGRPSEVDPRKDIPPLAEQKMDLVRILAKEEVAAAIDSFEQTAVGVDGRSVGDLRSVNLDSLTLILNLILVLNRLPTSIATARTTLIPKVARPQTPSEFRPITVTSVILRTFHKVLVGRLAGAGLISQRQKGFVAEDGCAINLVAFQTLVARAKRLKSSLHVAFVDMRKAFDSISHDSMSFALRSKGVPEPLVAYIMRMYQVTDKTMICGSEITVGCGVRQGDPLSSFLFNLVLDLSLGTLNERLGYRWGDRWVTHLAFADDIVLVSSSTIGLQSLLDTFVTETSKVGLQPNPAKCGSLAIVVLGKAKKWVVDANHPPTINGREIPALGPAETLKYLGLQVGAFCGGNSVDALQTLLNNTTSAPLKPSQRMWILNNTLIPKLLHQLVLTPVTKGLLKSLDIKIRATVRSWLKLPKDCPIAMFEASVKDGGLGIFSFLLRIPSLQCNRIDGLAISEDWLQQMVYEDEFVQTWKTTLLTLHRADETKRAVQDRTMETLTATCDGRGLTGARAEAAISSHSWLSDGTKLIPGHRYVDAIKIRFNCLPTDERCNRGRQRMTCKLGCGANDGLGHLLQTCPILHGLRCKRHNGVLDLLEKELSRKVDLIRREPHIHGGRNIYIPDLVTIKNRTACVLDVQVVADAGVKSLGDYHTSKRDKYNQPAVLRYLHALAPVDNITFCPVTISWRGLLYNETSIHLKEVFGCSNDFLKLMVVRSLEASAKMFGQYRRTGGRVAQ